jgi:hypothetical protein
MSQRPPRDLDWVPDDSTGINVPSQTKQNAGWIVEKPARQFFNWMWNRLSRWTHYFSGQSQEWIVIDSTNTNEKDYDTLAAYIADSPAAGDKVLVKETQVLTAQMIIPDGITLRILDGVNFTRSTLEANSVIKFGSDIIIEGVLNLVLSQTGTTAKSVEFDGDNVVGKINIENASTGTLTTAYHINANKTGNRTDGFAQNTGGGALTNTIVDNSTEDSNLLIIIDEPNNIVISTVFVDRMSVQTIGGIKTFTDSPIIKNGSPLLEIFETDVTADNKRWQIRAVGEQLLLSMLNDAGDTFTDVMVIDRTGTTIDKVRLNGVVSVNGLATRSIDIGTWDMNADTTKLVAHGLTGANIRKVSVSIRADNESDVVDLNYDDSTGTGEQGHSWDNSDIIMSRKLNGFFDDTFYDSIPGNNRGWITISYIA